MALLALMSDATRSRSVGAVFESCVVLASGAVNVTFAQSALLDLASNAADELVMNHADGFEVQLANGTWRAVQITAHDGNQLQLGGLGPAAQAGPGPILLGLRYAWRDHACCPRFYSADPLFSNWMMKDRDHPQMNGVCMPKNCSVYTKGSDLPATPFTVAMGPRSADGSQRCAEFVSTGRAG